MKRRRIDRFEDKKNAQDARSRAKTRIKPFLHSARSFSPFRRIVKTNTERKYIERSRCVCIRVKISKRIKLLPRVPLCLSLILENTFEARKRGITVINSRSLFLLHRSTTFPTRNGFRMNLNGFFLI